MLKVLILVFSFINLSFCIHGSVEIDELSFDRVVSKFKTAIVKFDTQFPYGIDHEEWTNFVSQINNKSISDTDTDNILTAIVGIKDFGEFDNKQLGERYGVKDVFPSIKMFLNGDLTKAIDFPVCKFFSSIKNIDFFLNNFFYLVNSQRQDNSRSIICLHKRKC